MAEIDREESSSPTSRGQLLSGALRVAIALVLVGGLAHRLLLAQESEYPTYDGALYLSQSTHLSRTGDLYFSSFPPGWPILVALAAALSGAERPGDYLSASELVNMGLGLAIFALSLRWATRAGATRAVRWTLALLLWIVPLYVRLCIGDLSEIAYLSLQLAGLVAWGARRPWLAGAAWGWAYLVRPEALLTFVLILGAELWRPTLRVLPMLASWAVFFLGHVFHVRWLTGEWTLSSKSGFLREVVEGLRPEEMLAVYAQNLRALASFTIDLTGLILPLFAVGGLLIRPPRWALMLAPLAVLPVFTFRMEPRYLIPYLPLLLLLALRVVDRGTAPAWLALRPRWRNGLLALLVVSFLSAQVDDYRHLRVNEESFPSMRAIGEWLHDQVGPRTVVAGRKPYVSFWAGCRFRRIPLEGGVADIVGWAVRERVDYLEVNLLEARILQRGLSPLAGPSPYAPPGQLELVRQAAEPGRLLHQTNLFRVVSPERAP